MSLTDDQIARAARDLVFAVLDSDQTAMLDEECSVTGDVSADREDGEEAAPVRLVRQTVDLPAERHAAFARWRLELALEAGMSRLTTQDALNALVAVALSDEGVTRLVSIALK